jgi:hypothetical protein
MSTPTQAEADAHLLRAIGAQPEHMPPTVVDIPHVTGAGTVGSTLNCTMGNWEGEPTSYTYEWQADTTNVLGSGDTYVVDEVAVGHEVVCVVTATNPYGSSKAPPSNAVAITATAAREAGERSGPPRERERERNASR